MPDHFSDTYADELFSSPALCRRLLQFQRQVEKGTEVAVGSSVQFHGLKNTQELNGLRGTPLCFEASTGRWVVAVDGETREVRVKPENVSVVVEPVKGRWECVDAANALRVIGRARKPDPGEEGCGTVVELAWRSSKTPENWITNFTPSLVGNQNREEGGQGARGFPDSILLNEGSCTPERARELG